jgi:CRISPR-associated protein Cas2
MQTDFVVAYDITNPRRLQRLHRFLKQRLMPIEYSVFYAGGEDPRSMLKIMNEAAQLIDPRTDDLRCYPLPQRGLRLRLGQATLPAGIYYSDLPASWCEQWPERE